MIRIINKCLNQNSLCHLKMINLISPELIKSYKITLLSETLKSIVVRKFFNSSSKLIDSELSLTTHLTSDLSAWLYIRMYSDRGDIATLEISLLLCGKFFSSVSVLSFSISLELELDASTLTSIT